ncbi:hypothetical protein [Staphylococcus cohnii]|uniref:hypothetical protein n=1 Tax=Staphylococcus cohnii TaxID=29382 RepID=UPI00254D088D|nr:hypothetical protein [Staphylococcus cohnii]WIL69774.1 hypothetical protein QMK35_00655 [Staphylococcus cohnii]
MFNIDTLNLTTVFNSVIAAIIGIFLKMIISNYFDIRKWDYYSYILMMILILFSITISFIYYYLFLISPIYNYFSAIILFLFSCIAMAIFILGIFLTIKRLENNFTVYIDIYNKAFLKKSLNKNFKNEMLLLDSSKDLENRLKNDVNIIFKNMYKGEKFTYYDKESNMFTEINFIYYKNAFCRLKSISSKKLRSLEVIFIIITIFNVGLIYLSLSITGIESLFKIIAFLLVTINFTSLITCIFIISSISIDILNDNTKHQLKIIEYINKGNIINGVKYDL